MRKRQASCLAFAFLRVDFTGVDVLKAWRNRVGVIASLLALAAGGGAFAVTTPAPAAQHVLEKSYTTRLPGRSAGLLGAVRDMALSHDGRRAYVSMSTDAGPSLQILDISRHPAALVATVPDVPAGPLAVAPDGRTVYVLGNRRTLTVVDVGDAPPHVSARHALDDPFHDLALSADGALLYLGSDLGMDHAIRAWRTRDAGPTDFAPAVSADIVSLELSPDGASLAAVGGIDNVLLVLGTDDARAQVRTWHATPDSSLGAFVFSADGKAIYQATAAADGIVVTRRDIDSGKIVAHSKVLPLSVAGDLAVSPDGEHVYVAGATERTVMVLSTQALAVEQVLHLASSPAAALAVSWRGDTYATLYVAQGGDLTASHSYPVVAAYRQVDPGPSQRPAPVTSRHAGMPWIATMLGGCVVLLGGWRLASRYRRQG